MLNPALIWFLTNGVAVPRARARAGQLSADEMIKQCALMHRALRARCATKPTSLNYSREPGARRAAKPVAASRSLALCERPNDVSASYISSHGSSSAPLLSKELLSGPGLNPSTGPRTISAQRLPPQRCTQFKLKPSLYSRSQKYVNIRNFRISAVEYRGAWDAPSFLGVRKLA